MLLDVCISDEIHRKIGLMIWLSTLMNSCQWRDLQLADATIRTIEANLNFPCPVPIQSLVIPNALSKKDVVVISPTGSGKTLCYLLPLHTLLLESQSPTALIILPTQELALQVYSVAQTLFRQQDLFFVSRRKTLGNLSSTTLIIGTPGALLNESILPHFPRISYLVLDEVDRLLDLGGGQMMETCKKIINLLPKDKRTMFFSATMDPEHRNLWIKTCRLRNPLVLTHDDVALQTSSRDQGSFNIPESLVNTVWLVSECDKMSLFVSYLENQSDPIKMIVFVSTTAMVDYLFLVLPSLVSHIEFTFIHGKMSNTRRSRTLEEFKSKSSNQKSPEVLIATDLVSRGLDISNIDTVLQLDPPLDPSSFVHRAGRTARMGKRGKNILMLVEHELAFVEYLSQKGITVIIEKKQDLFNELLFNKLREMALESLNLHQVGKKALVSSMRAYSQHRLSFIFRFKRFQIAEKARSMGLLNLPKCPELNPKGKPKVSYPSDWKWENEMKKEINVEHAKQRKCIAGEHNDNVRHGRSKMEETVDRNLTSIDSQLFANVGIDVNDLKQMFSELNSDEFESRIIDIEDSLLRKLKRKKITNEVYSSISSALEDFTSNMRIEASRKRKINNKSTNKRKRKG
ncbi:hypothetical protein P9112_012105 [Eukaryota sp. TZLM1-RC]